MERAFIRQAVLDEIVRHAAEELPNECCGLLLAGGASREDGIELDEAIRTRNADASPTRFLVHPRDLLAAMRYADRVGKPLAGVYHSHPDGPPHPSPVDVAEAYFPSFVHVIVGPVRASDRPAVRAFRIADGNFRSVELVPTR